MSLTKYVYTDENGVEVYSINRSVDPESGKKFFYPTVPGRKDHNLDGVKRVPYNLVGLLKACDSNETVYVVEGEKCADDLITRGYCATTSAGGSKWDWPREWAEYFVGAYQVIVFPDNDIPGMDCAKHRARVIAFKQDNVKLVELPGLGANEDIYDWFRIEGNDSDGLDRLVDYAGKYELIIKTVDYNVEECIIAYLLRPGNDHVREVIMACSPDDFDNLFWRQAYVSILGIYSLDLIPDVSSVAVRMKRSGYSLPQDDIEKRLWALFEKQFVFSAWSTWVNDLVDQSVQRSVSKGLREVAQQLALGVSGVSLLDVWDKVELRRTLNLINDR